MRSCADVLSTFRFLRDLEQTPVGDEILCVLGSVAAESLLAADGFGSIIERRFHSSQSEVNK